MPPKRDRSTTVILERLERIVAILSRDLDKHEDEMKQVSALFQDRSFRNYQLIENRLIKMGTANSVGHTDTRERISEVSEKLDMLIPLLERVVTVLEKSTLPWWERMFRRMEQKNKAQAIRAVSDAL